jgi:non-heme chloroperoxidase
MRAQFVRQCRQDRHVAVSPPFGVDEAQLRGIAIQQEILDADVHKLIHPCPGLEQRLEHQAVGAPVAIDGLRKQLAANRTQFYLDLASGPFYSYNRPGAKISQGVIQNWWRQGMMGGAKAHYDGIKAFSETDFTEDLKIIDVPTLVMHGDDDQIVPITASALLSVKLLKNGTLKVYKEFPHGMCTTHADVVNADLLAFIKG